MQLTALACRVQRSWSRAPPPLGNTVSYFSGVQIPGCKSILVGLNFETRKRVWCRPFLFILSSQNVYMNQDNKLGYRRGSTWRSSRRSRSFNTIHFGTKRKPTVCDFLLVNTSYLAHRLLDIGQY